VLKEVRVHKVPQAVVDHKEHKEAKEEEEHQDLVVHKELKVQ
jgi:hypothetical protein